uniref:Secreted protein n=1 Tax=Mesocestoides corti TaxID=53468 RepID=A0A5K3G1K4_MESCO
MGKTGALYILALFFLFSRWSVTRLYNGDEKFVSSLAFSPRRVIQCPHAATQPEVAPPVTRRRFHAMLTTFTNMDASICI